MKLLSALLLGLSMNVVAADFSLPGFTLGAEAATAPAEIQLYGLKVAATPELQDGKLKALELSLYQGDSADTFVQTLKLIASQWRTDWGGVLMLDSARPEPVELTTDESIDKVQQFFTGAPTLAATYRQTHLAETVLLVDWQPKTQPDNGRLHLSLQYHSVSNSYKLMLYLDQQDAAARTATSVVNLQG